MSFIEVRRNHKYCIDLKCHKVIIIIIHHHMYLTSVPPNTHGMSGICASTSRTPVIFLQAQRSCVISSFIPIAFMPLSTQPLHVLLGAPLPTTPVTFTIYSSLPSTQHAQTISTLLSGFCSQHTVFFLLRLTPSQVLTEVLPHLTYAFPPRSSSRIWLRSSEGMQAILWK